MTELGDTVEGQDVLADCTERPWLTENQSLVRCCTLQMPVLAPLDLIQSLLDVLPASEGTKSDQLAMLRRAPGRSVTNQVDNRHQTLKSRKVFTRQVLRVTSVSIRGMDVLVQTIESGKQLSPRRLPTRCFPSSGRSSLRFLKCYPADVFQCVLEHETSAERLLHKAGTHRSPKT